MSEDRWPRVKALFQATVELPPEERDTFLAAAAGEDAALRREVEALLVSDAAPDGVLDRLPQAGETVLAGAHTLPVSIGRETSGSALAGRRRIGPYEIVGFIGA